MASVCICDLNEHIALTFLNGLLAFNSGSRGKTEVILREEKIGISKMLQRRYRLINLSLPRDRTGMDSVDWVFNVSSFIF